MTLEKMREKIRDALDELHQEWLMENYPDEIMCKDDLIKMVDDGTYYDEFMDAVKKEF